MKKPNPFFSKVRAGDVRVVPIVAGQEAHVATKSKVRPVELKGMDLEPLSQLMARHDPHWESRA